MLHACLEKYLTLACNWISSCFVSYIYGYKFVILCLLSFGRILPIGWTLSHFLAIKAAEHYHRVLSWQYCMDTNMCCSTSFVYPSSLPLEEDFWTFFNFYLAILYLSLYLVRSSLFSAGEIRMALPILLSYPTLLQLSFLHDNQYVCQIGAYLEQFIPIPRVLRLFGQRLVARRDSGELKFYYHNLNKIPVHHSLSWRLTAGQRAWGLWVWDWEQFGI